MNIEYGRVLRINRGLEDLRQEIPGVSQPTTQKESCVLVTDNSVCQ